MVVRVFTEVKEFILSCVKFSEDLNLSQVKKTSQFKGCMHEV